MTNQEKRQYAILSNFVTFLEQIKLNFATTIHTHKVSDITDLPKIPNKTSDLINDSGYKTTDNNTTYSLSKNGNTITLTGSDGLETSVEDADTVVQVDSELSGTSENPVQNKIIHAALKLLVPTTRKINNKLLDADISLNADDVGADPSGSSDNAIAQAKAYTDKSIADLVGSADSTMDTLGEIQEAFTKNKSVVDALNDSIGSKANDIDLKAHLTDKNNPHGVTSSQLGLENVENKNSEQIRQELTAENVTDALGFNPSRDNHEHDGLIKTPSIEKAYVIGSTSKVENTNKEVFDTDVYLTEKQGELHLHSLEIGSAENNATLLFDEESGMLTISFS